MKKFELTILALLIFLTGCSKNDFSKSEISIGIPSTNVSPSPEAANTTDTGQNIQLSSTPIADRPTITEAPPLKVDETTQINGPKYAYENWVESTVPENGSLNISPSASISITFGQDMNPDSLNENTIQIIEGKHSHNISGLYNYDYDAKTRVLNITFKDPNCNIGSGNGLDITITKDIMNSKKVKLGVDLHFGYCGQ